MKPLRGMPPAQGHMVRAETSDNSILLLSSKMKKKIHKAEMEVKFQKKVAAPICTLWELCHDMCQDTMRALSSTDTQQAG